MNMMVSLRVSLFFLVASFFCPIAYSADVPVNPNVDSVSISNAEGDATPRCLNSILYLLLSGECGNDFIRGSEVCDGTDLDGEDCISQGFYSGTLACNPTCDGFDKTGCIGTCGDSIVNGTETCDDTDLDGEDCITQGFYGGTLACKPTCDGFDKSSCAAAPGDTCDSAVDLSAASFPYQNTGTFDVDPANGFSCDPSATNVVWFSYTPTASGFYNISATNNTATNAYSRLAVMEGTSCSPYGTELSCVTSTSKTRSTTVQMVADSTYLIAFYTDGDVYTMVDPVIDIQQITTNPGEVCQNPIDISVETFPYQALGNFSMELDPGMSCDPTSTNMIWYSYTAGITGEHEINATNNTTTFAYSRLAVLDGTSCSPYGTELNCVTSTNKTPSTTVDMVVDTTYLIAFWTDGNTYTMVDPQIEVIPPQPFTVDWCNVQWPSTITSEEGQAEVIYGQLYSLGLTDQTAGIDPNPYLIAQVGIGPDGSDPTVNPSLMVWNPAYPNVGVGNNDEYQSTIIVPPTGTYDYAYRFSGDGGATWTYCDLTDNVYDVADAGAMTPSATTVSAVPAELGEVIITEVMQNPSTLSDTTGEWFELYNPTGTDWNLNGCTIKDQGTDIHTISGNFILPAGGFTTASRSAAPGFTPGYVFSDVFLANGDDELYITCGSVDMDTVEYDGGIVWPDPTGKSMSLDPASTDHTANDDGSNWCEGSQYYNGDFGSPNLPNTSCP